MYAIICIGFFIFVWIGFLFVMLRNIKRNTDIKKHNQKYYEYKINNLKTKVYGKETETDG